MNKKIHWPANRYTFFIAYVLSKVRRDAFENTDSLKFRPSLHRSFLNISMGVTRRKQSTNCDSDKFDILNFTKMSESNTATSAVEEEQTPCRLKSGNQRRSIIFRRRSLAQTSAGDQSNVACDKQKPDKRIVNNDDDASPGTSGKKTEDSQFDLQKYIDDLKQEKKMWKQTLLQRRRQHKAILKQMTNIQHTERDVDLNLLSESERTFILVRPNYEHICEKAKKLSVMAIETEISRENVLHLHNRCMLRAQKKLDDLTKRIIDMVD